jgi:ABC-type transport system involved in cytochrome c biogenesis permease subunit
MSSAKNDSTQDGYQQPLMDKVVTSAIGFPIGIISGLAFKSVWFNELWQRLPQWASIGIMLSLFTILIQETFHDRGTNFYSTIHAAMLGLLVILAWFFLNSLFGAHPDPAMLQLMQKI